MTPEIRTKSVLKRAASPSNSTRRTSSTRTRRGGSTDLPCRSAKHASKQKEACLKALSEVARGSLLRSSPSGSLPPEVARNFSIALRSSLTGSERVS